MGSFVIMVKYGNSRVATKGNFLLMFSGGYLE